MENKKTSLTANGMIWFGASVSIAEILTGTAIAPLGFIKGTAAIFIGHFIGCILMYLAGIIGAEKEISAMESVRMSFGKYGAIFFALMNVLQLVGWTAVMTGQGAGAAAEAGKDITADTSVWAGIIGVFILIWILIGITNIAKLNIVVISALFMLTLFLSFKIFDGGLPISSNFGNDHVGSGISFGMAVELSAAMPLSWLPLISDYTRTAKRPHAATAVSAAVYFFGSCWMFIIGMGAAIITGASDIPSILVSAGFGIAGLIIVLLSTVTTTFMDAYSAGVSSVSIWSGIREKLSAVVVTVIGTLIAVFAPLGNIEKFLYLIGSVFAPMVAILISDYFILKRDSSENLISFRNSVIWIIGFTIYRFSMTVSTLLGNTLPVIAIVIFICVISDHMIKVIMKK